jgi:hypothetical protein
LSELWNEVFAKLTNVVRNSDKVNPNATNIRSCGKNPKTRMRWNLRREGEQDKFIGFERL